MRVHHTGTPGARSAKFNLLYELIFGSIVVGITIGNMLKRRPHVVVVHFMTGKTIAVFHPIAAEMVIITLQRRWRLRAKLIKQRRVGGRSEEHTSELQSREK